MRRKRSHRQKLESAAQILLYKRHRQPGLKGWELRKSLGADYPQILDLLNRHLEGMGLTIRKVLEDGTIENDLSAGQNDSTRFYIGFRKPPSLKEAKMTGWRIDDLAALAVILAHILTHEGKAPRSEIEELLKKKMVSWKIRLNLDRFIRQGYLQQDEKGIIYLDWRARAEVDSKELLNALMRREPSKTVEEAMTAVTNASDDAGSKPANEPN